MSDVNNYSRLYYLLAVLLDLLPDHKNWVTTRRVVICPIYASLTIKLIKCVVNNLLIFWTYWIHSSKLYAGDLQFLSFGKRDIYPLILRDICKASMICPDVELVNDSGQFMDHILISVHYHAIGKPYT
jgi:hypothetical protein